MKLGGGGGGGKPASDGKSPKSSGNSGYGCEPVSCSTRLSAYAPFAYSRRQKLGKFLYSLRQFCSPGHIPVPPVRTAGQEARP